VRLRLTNLTQVTTRNHRFQSYHSAIKTKAEEVIMTDPTYFNPTIVRLRRHSDSVDVDVAHLFQSYHSAIKTIKIHA